MAAEPDQMTEYDWFGKARSCETRGDLEEAIKAYEKAIDINPDFAKAWYYKAKLHLRLDQKDKAIECAKKALELKPSWEKFVKDIIG